MDVDRSTEQRPSDALVLLFDLGGVIIDLDFDRVFNSWASSAACDADTLRRSFVFDDRYEAHERGEISGGEYFEHLRAVLGLDLDDVAIERGWNDVYLGEVEGIAELLADARERWPLYAFTNTNAVHQREWSRAYASVLGLFEAVYSSSELGVRKPDPEAFLEVSARMGVAPSAVHFFDDLAENVDAARSVGMSATLVGSIDDVRQALRP